MKISRFRFFPGKKSKSQNFDFSLTFQKKKIGKCLVSKNIFSIFSTTFFDLENLYFCMDFFVCQSEISPGIQKSYLENRAIILKIRKTTKTKFLPYFPDFGTLLRGATLNNTCLQKLNSTCLQKLNSTCLSKNLTVLRHV